MKIVITGASKGIGEAIAKKYQNLGHKVINIDLVNSKKVDTFVADINDAKALEEIAKKVGKIDILICNAGAQMVSKLEKTKPEDFKKVVDLNLVGTYNTIHAFMNNVKDGGHILNITSVHAEVPRLDKFAYDAAKAGINMLTKEVALALAPRKVHVNALALGATNTPMNKELMENPAALKKASARIPFGRIAEANEVAEAVVSLLTKSFDYMTGSIVTFDGGRSLN